MTVRPSRAAGAGPTLELGIPSGQSPETLIPPGVDDLTLDLAGCSVKLTNLRKIFWKQGGTTKGDLLRYYAGVASVLLPHIRDRAMVMKRYPNGAEGEFFFMKRTPSPRPDWLRTCPIDHDSGNIIEFPLIQDLPSLLWVVNLGCIDLNPWYSRCDDIDRPDFLHFDMDPVPGASFETVVEASLLVRDALQSLGMTSYAKTTGSKGIHIYVPIERGPLQKDVWTVAKAFARTLEVRHPKVLTAEYRVAKRPRGRVLVDYNQNAWGRTLASVYSVRPRPLPTVSTPVTWTELEKGAQIDQFRIDTVPARVKRQGDLWAPLVEASGRFPLESILEHLT